MRRHHFYTPPPLSQTCRFVVLVNFGRDLLWRVSRKTESKLNYSQDLQQQQLLVNAVFGGIPLWACWNVFGLLVAPAGGRLSLTNALP